MTRYDFKEQLKIGERGEQELDTFFTGQGFTILPVSMEQQFKGVDRIFERDGFRATVEYKTDLIAHRTGNAFIEEVQNRGLGWLFTCTADRLAYYVPSLGFVWWLRPSTLRGMYQSGKWGMAFPRRMVQGKRGFSASGILLPLDVLSKVSMDIFIVN